MYMVYTIYEEAVTPTYSIISYGYIVFHLRIFNLCPLCQEYNLPV